MRWPLPIVVVRRGKTWKDWPDGQVRNAQNNPVRVQIADQVRPGQSWLGVLAQEVYESRHKLAWARFLWMSDGAREDMEVLGHAIEARVAYVFNGMHHETYLLSEAHALIDASSSYRRKGMFRSETITSMLERLRKAEVPAREWCIEHHEFITKWQEKRRGW